MSIIKDYLSLVGSAIADLPEDKIRDCIETLKDAHAGGRQVFLLGNGGSATTASHIACDLQKGRQGDYRQAIQGNVDHRQRRPDDRLGE